MMQPVFSNQPDLQPEAVASNVNTVARFLAMPHVLPPSPAQLRKTSDRERVDAAVLMGNSVLHTIETAATVLKNDMSPLLVVSGGIGHSTGDLRNTVANDQRYDGFEMRELSEAEIMAEVLVRWYAIDREKLLLDTTSTNCGANAEHSRATLKQHGISAESLLIVQDPTMQRRSHATFRRVYDSEQVELCNCPGFVPEIAAVEDRLEFTNPDIPGLWNMERYLSLVMGEIPRLRDDGNGYGPNGRGFIAHVDIPDEVETAYKRLAGPLRDYVRDI